MYFGEDSQVGTVLAAIDFADRLGVAVIDRRFQLFAVNNRLRPLAKLTARERDVLTLLQTGLRNSDIATELTVSQNTIEFHVGNILMKLAARNRAQAAANARLMGLS